MTSTTAMASGRLNTTFVVGTYLIPKLVAAGHEVISVSRQQRASYQSHPAWQAVQESVKWLIDNSGLLS